MAEGSKQSGFNTNRLPYSNLQRSNWRLVTRMNKLYFGDGLNNLRESGGFIAK